MTDPPIDPDLLAALEALDDACDARSIDVDVDEAAVRGAGGQGVLGMAITLRPMVGSAREHVIRAPYEEGRTAEWLRALAGRVLAARSWAPAEWAKGAVADVLGTDDAPADEVAATAELPPEPTS